MPTRLRICIDPVCRRVLSDVAVTVPDMTGDRTTPQILEVVHGAGITLAAYSSVDVDILRAVFADPETQRWNPGPEEGADPVAWVTEWFSRRNDWSTGDHLSWAVRDEDDALVGSVSMFHLDLEQGDGELGYWVAPAARGRGVATRAVNTAARHAFERVGLRRLYLYHAVDNPVSCRVAERCGFRLEGTLRSSHRYGDGEYYDEHLHGRLADDPVPD
jgi:RimJ/RimL family protein N-acetyltransferase